MDENFAKDLMSSIFSFLWKGICWLFSWSLENPIYAIISILVLLLFWLMLDHIFDKAEGDARDKTLKIILSIVFVIVVVLVLQAIESGTIKLPW